MDADCVAFETDYKGKLAEQQRKMAENGSPKRCDAMRRSTISPAVSARMPASFMPATASIPAISKFYGDVSERLTAASTHLLFFALELNRV